MKRSELRQLIQEELLKEDTKISDLKKADRQLTTIYQNVSKISKMYGVKDSGFGSECAEILYAISALRGLIGKKLDELT